MVQHGKRRRVRAGGAGVREADADERDRVPAQGADVRALLADRAAREDAPRGSRPATFVELVSHRHLRYAQRPAPPRAARDRRSRSSRDGWVYDVVLAAQLGLLAAAAAGVGIARYYVLVSWATVVALWNYLRRGVPATWQPAEGTR